MNNKKLSRTSVTLLCILLAITVSVIGYAAIYAQNELKQISSGQESPQDKDTTVSGGSLLIVYGAVLRNLDDITCLAGESFSLRVVFNPDVIGGEPVSKIWKSRNESVFTINPATGTITAVSPGVATCTVTAGDDKAESTIRVVSQRPSDYTYEDFLEGDTSFVCISDAAYSKMNVKAFQELTGAETHELELIHWNLVYGAKIAGYEDVSVSNNQFITPGMDQNWAAYDLTDSDGKTYVVILRKPVLFEGTSYGYDFTAVLDSDGRLLCGMIDSGIVPALYQDNEY